MANQQIALDIIAKDLASATLQRVNANVEQFTQTTGRAHAGSVRMGEGLSKAGNALNNLAGDMLGVNNKVANLAEGLLTFAGGGALVTGVALGITAIGGALFALTKQARDAEAGWQDFLRTVQKTSPLAQLGAQVDALREKLAAPEFGAYQRIARALGLAESRDATILKLAQVEQAYAQVFQSVSEQAAKGGAKVAQSAADQTAKALRDRIANDPTLRGYALADIQAPAVPLEVRRGGMDGADLLDPAAFPEQAQTVISTLEQIKSVASGVAAGFLEMGASIGDAFALALASGEGFLGSLKAVQRALAQKARTNGAYDAVAALSAFGRGLFGDSTQFAAAAKLAASSAAWFALSATLGGGGGSGIRGAVGGGAGSGRDRETAQRDVAEQKGETVIVMKKQPVMTDDPALVDFITDILRNAGQRRVTFQYT